MLKCIRSLKLWRFSMKESAAPVLDLTAPDLSLDWKDLFTNFKRFFLNVYKKKISLKISWRDSFEKGSTFLWFDWNYLTAPDYNRPSLILKVKYISSQSYKISVPKMKRYLQKLNGFLQFECRAGFLFDWNYLTGADHNRPPIILKVENISKNINDFGNLKSQFQE